MPSLSDTCGREKLTQHEDTKVKPWISRTEKEDMRHRSILAIGTESTSFDTIDEDFETTKIKVQLLGLMNGIVMETTNREASRINAQKTNLLGSEPIFAVVTGFHEVPEKGVVVSTHLPSLAVEKQAFSANNKKHMLMAMWPADFDPRGDQTSTVVFQRKMKKTPVQSLASVQPNSKKTCVYTTESLVLAISLMRGKEMITLGTVNVHFTGSETRSIQVNLPVKLSKYGVKKAQAMMKGTKVNKKHRRKNRRRLMKPLSFKSDPTRSYRLDEDTILSMLIETEKADLSTTNDASFEYHPRHIPVIRELVEEDSPQSPRGNGKFTQTDILFDLAATDALAKEEHGRSDEDSKDNDEESVDISSPSDEEVYAAFENLEDSEDEQPISSHLSGDSSDLFEVNIDAAAKAILARSGDRKSVV